MRLPFMEYGTHDWDSSRDFRKLRQEMDHLFHRYDGGGRTNGSSYPALNIWSNDEISIVTAEVPGVDADDLDISVRDDQMTIRGTRVSTECSENEIFHRRERGCGEFVRTLGLPFRVEGDEVSAEYKLGILTVTLPRAEYDKPKKIKIKTGKKQR